MVYFGLRWLIQASRRSKCAYLDAARHILAPSAPRRSPWALAGHRTEAAQSFLTLHEHNLARKRVRPIDKRGIDALIFESSNGIRRFVPKQLRPGCERRVGLKRGEATEKLYSRNVVKLSGTANVRSIFKSIRIHASGSSCQQIRTVLGAV